MKKISFSDSAAAERLSAKPRRFFSNLRSADYLMSAVTAAANFAAATALTAVSAICAKHFPLRLISAANYFSAAGMKAEARLKILIRQNYRQSVTGGAVLETRIGSVFLGGSFAEGGRRKLYFSLGRFF